MEWSVLWAASNARGKKMPYSQFTYKEVWIWAIPGGFHGSTTASMTFILLSYCYQGPTKLFVTPNTVPWLEISQAGEKGTGQERPSSHVFLSFTMEGEKSLSKTSTCIKTRYCVLCSQIWATHSPLTKPKENRACNGWGLGKRTII